MNEEARILRIRIDERWTANDFSSSLLALDRLYTLRLLLENEYEDLRDLRRNYPEASLLLPPYRFEDWISVARTRGLPVNGALEPLDRDPTLLPELLEPTERLSLRRVIYGSPGIKDLVGVGEVIGHLKDLLVKLIDLFATREERALKNERSALENDQLRVDIAKKYVELGRELGYSKREMRRLVASAAEQQRPLEALIRTGKIISADTIDSDRHDNE